MSIWALLVVCGCTFGGWRYQLCDKWLKWRDACVIAKGKKDINSVKECTFLRIRDVSLPAGGRMSIYRSLHIEGRERTVCDIASNHAGLGWWWLALYPSDQAIITMCGQLHVGAMW